MGDKSKKDKNKQQQKNLGKVRGGMGGNMAPVNPRTAPTQPGRPGQGGGTNTPGGFIKED